MFSTTSLLPLSAPVSALAKPFEVGRPNSSRAQAARRQLNVPCDIVLHGAPIDTVGATALVVGKQAGDLDAVVGEQDVKLGPHVWTRNVVFTWNGNFGDERETYFLCHVPSFELDATNWTDAERIELAEHHWWPADEIEASTELRLTCHCWHNAIVSELFVPPRLAELLRPILRSELPDAPIEAGR